MSTQTPRIRSLYRALLRELPPRPTRSPLQDWVRERIVVPSSSSSSTISNPSPAASRAASTSTAAQAVSDTAGPSRAPATEAAAAAAAAVTEKEEAISLAEQSIQYLHAQRTYVTLLERYNPGMGMSEEERVRLSARRVGLDLPQKFSGGAE